MDNAIGFPNIYPMDSDLSDGKRYPAFERLGPVYYSVYCVYSNFKHLLARISEYFALRRG